FRGESASDISEQIANRAPASPAEVNPSVPFALQTVILRALEKERNRRYQSAAEMRSDLQRLMASSAPVPPAVPRLRRRRTPAVAAIAVVAVIAVTGYRYLTPR